MIITDKIKTSDYILASGGFADIRYGRYMGHPVAMKTARVTPRDDVLKIRKVSINNVLFPAWDAASTFLLQQFCKEAILWNALSHPNVLKLIGVHGDMEKGQFTTVSEWMAHGNIMEYIKNNHTNRLELVRAFTFPTTSFTKSRQ